jgi:2,5-diketo-D-gluconate reductase A
MTPQPTILLNDEVLIPQVGLGVYLTPQDTTNSVVEAALRAGYRHVDTAAIYGNEVGVGQGVRSSGVARNDIFLTTKLWNEAHGYDSTLRAFDASLARLGVDHLDLYLIHWPSPRRDLYVETWKALVRLKQDGRTRSIGVSNFAAEHLERIVGETGVVPALNQIELHPRFQQRALRELHQRLGIATQSWSPLGQGTLLNDPVIASIAAKHGRTAAQVIIRWHLENHLIVIPKSVTSSRIRENFDVFGFRLDEEDLMRMGELDSDDGRIGPDPLTSTF